MKLNNQSLLEKEQWIKAGYHIPAYDRETVRKNTLMEPFWIHFGAGNIFRAFQANVVQQLLNRGILDRGLIVAEGYDYEIIEKVNKPHDDLSLLVTLKTDGSVEKTVIGSIVESLCMDASHQKDYMRLQQIFCKPSLQMASFTITEKGYQLIDGKGETLSFIRKDFDAGFDYPQSYIGKLTSLLYHRYKNGRFPLALVSMDNCAHNGTKLHLAVHTMAENWAVRGFVEQDFVDQYIDNPKLITFPWSMIDKITPRPSQKVKELLLQDGYVDVEQIITSKGTYVSSFVNTEETQYLVIEDSFPNGRPKIDTEGVIFADRDTVDRVEKMKVCICLNPLHTALAIFGCLLSYDKIHEEMKDPDLKRLLLRMGYEEGLPVVVDPGIINPSAFLYEVLTIRLPNPFMEDTPQRIATDTSRKLGIRYGETIRAYRDNRNLNIKDLRMIPLVIAGWCRYLMGIDDFGKEFTLSSDPMLLILQSYLKDITIGQTEEELIHKALEPILSMEEIFGVNLYEIGLGARIEKYFTEMIEEPGAVRNVLKQVVNAE